MKEKGEYIVFYDGECGFCNRSVAWIIKRDITNEINFASIQSEFTHSFFSTRNFEKPDLSTFYFFSDGVLYNKSTAAIKLTKHFSGGWRLLRFGRIIPLFLRDYLYDMIAKRRQSISKGYCFLPSKEQRKRFLDQDMD